MTRDQVQSVHDDIAYMKALAQEGRRAPPFLGERLHIGDVVVNGLNLVSCHGVSPCLVKRD